MTYLEHLFGGYLSGLLEEHADKMTTYARQFAEMGRNSKAIDFVGSLETINEMYATPWPDAGEIQRADLPDQCPASRRRRIRPFDKKSCRSTGSM